MSHSMAAKELANQKQTKKTTHWSRGQELKFHSLNVQISSRDILKDVYGIAKPGEMLAIMGPSGSGKTTLLNTLAGRRGMDSGHLTLNSQSLCKQMKRRISYVLQQDIFLSNLTCWETLWYTALLRLPGSMPTSEKRERVMEIVDALDMRKCLHTKVGDDSSRGLSGGEKKRTTIACELLTNPALMLLDEPTSGLDSSTAYSLCSTMKEFAKLLGKTVVVAIHQPSSQIFNMFDKLLVLCEGQVAYFGDTQSCAQHFHNLELPCPANYNIADHILEQIKGPPEIREKIIKSAANQMKGRWPELMNNWTEKMAEHKLQYAPSPSEITLEKKMATDVETSSIGELSSNGSQIDDNRENTTSDEVAFYDVINEKDSKVRVISTSSDCLDNHEKTTPSEMNLKLHRGTTPNDIGCYVNTEFISDKETSSADSGIDELSMEHQREYYEPKWLSSFLIQYTVLLQRCFKQTYPSVLSRWNVAQMVVLGVFAGMVWFQVKPIENEIENRHGLIFFCYIFASFNSALVSTLSASSDRTVINKERLAGYYRLSAYYAAKYSTDIPLLLILFTIFFIITFWISGLNTDFVVFLQYTLLLHLCCAATNSVGGFLGTVFQNVPVACVSSTTAMVMAMILGGFYTSRLPLWLDWIKYLSHVTHIYHAAQMIDFYNSDIRCAEEFSKYKSCRNSSILQTSFNVTQSSDPPVPTFINKEELLETYTMSSSGWTIQHHVFVLIGYTLTLKIVTYLVLRFVRKPSMA